MTNDPDVATALVSAARVREMRMWGRGPDDDLLYWCREYRRAEREMVRFKKIPEAELRAEIEQLVRLRAFDYAFRLGESRRYRGEALAKIKAARPVTAEGIRFKTKIELELVARDWTQATDDDDDAEKVD